MVLMRGQSAVRWLTGLSVVCLLGVAACGDDSPGGGEAANNAANNAVNNAPNNTVNNAPNNAVNNAPNNAVNNAPNNNTADVGGDDAMAMEDVSEGEDVVEDVAPDDVPDVGEDEVPDEGEEPIACVSDDECPENYLCAQGVCVINPLSRSYVEFNYVLEEPAALTTAISVIKGLFSDVGFFMVDFAPLDDQGESEMTYGGGDRLLAVDDGPDVFAWQIAQGLPTVQVRPMDPEAEDFDDRTWVAENFDYRLVALFGEGNMRTGLGFEAAQTTLTMTFSEDLTQIESGRLDGFITREEAESRELALEDNCLLALGLCPAYNCADPPMGTLAEVLDCNEVTLDADIDPNIEGHDAYSASIFFQSEEVIIQE